MTSEIQFISPAEYHPTRTRIQWLDALRGLFMILMALDHANYFIGKAHMGEFWGVSLPLYDSAFLFLTRFATHVCAPGFFFLMGISIILFADSRFRVGWSRAKIFRHYALRGIILIGLQLFLEDPAWMIGGIGNAVQMNTPPGDGRDVWFHFGVLSALGGAMIICSLLSYFRPLILLLIGIGAVAITAAVIPMLDVSTPYSPLLRLVIIPGQTNSVQVFYPLFPWIGLAAAGMAFGKILTHDQNRLPRLLLAIGAAMILSFIILRLTGFGSFHNAAGSQWPAFFNITKYPPDLAFIAFTMGINLCLVSLFSFFNSRLRINYPLRVFGKAALFFYIVHLYLFALIGLAFTDTANIGVVYMVWIIGLLILFPVCKLYSNFKRNTAPGSFWRLF